MLTCLQKPPSTHYRLQNSAILHLGLLLRSRCSHPLILSRAGRVLGMFAHESPDCSRNKGDECAARGSSENVRQKYLRIGRMEVRFNSGQAEKKLAAARSSQSSSQRIAEHSQTEMLCSARGQVACRNAADDLENETRYIHQNTTAVVHRSRNLSLTHAQALRFASGKKPALRRQRILWRRRVGDASA